MRHPFLDHNGLLAFAHRGDQDAGPENTMLAFEGAVRLGFDYIETDVQATSDGILVTFHDAILDRLTDHSGPIGQFTWSKLQKVKVGGLGSIPTLEDVLGHFPDLRFNIAPKSNTSVDLLTRVIRRTAAEHRVCVGSFSDRRLDRIRAMLPNVCTSMGRLETAKTRLYSFGFPVSSIVANCVQVPVKWRGIRIVDRRFIESLKKLGLQIHVWTINEPSEMRRLIKMGVDGLMTDHPSKLKAVLLAHGLWHQVD